MRDWHWTCVCVLLLLLWVSFAVNLLAPKNNGWVKKVNEHENTREVLGKKIDMVERLLTDRQADDAVRLVRAADAHVYVLTNVSSRTERFGLSLHSASGWSRECELVLAGGPAPPHAREGSKVVIDYYNERVSALRGALADNH